MATYGRQTQQIDVPEDANVNINITGRKDATDSAYGSDNTYNTTNAGTTPYEDNSTNTSGQEAKGISGLGQKMKAMFTGGNKKNDYTPEDTNTGDSTYANPSDSQYGTGAKYGAEGEGQQPGAGEKVKHKLTDKLHKKKEEHDVVGENYGTGVGYGQPGMGYGGVGAGYGGAGRDTAAGIANDGTGAYNSTGTGYTPGPDSDNNRGTTGLGSTGTDAYGGTTTGTYGATGTGTDYDRTRTDNYGSTGTGVGTGVGTDNYDSTRTDNYGSTGTDYENKGMMGKAADAVKNATGMGTGTGTDYDRNRTDNYGSTGTDTYSTGAPLHTIGTTGTGHGGPLFPAGAATENYGTTGTGMGSNYGTTGTDNTYNNENKGMMGKAVDAVKNATGMGTGTGTGTDYDRNRTDNYGSTGTDNYGSTGTGMGTGTYGTTGTDNYGSTGPMGQSADAVRMNNTAGMGINAGMGMGAGQYGNNTVNYGSTGTGMGNTGAYGTTGTDNYDNENRGEKKGLMGKITDTVKGHREEKQLEKEERKYGDSDNYGNTGAYGNTGTVSSYGTSGNADYDNENRGEKKGLMSKITDTVKGHKEEKQLEKEQKQYGTSDYATTRNDGMYNEGAPWSTGQYGSSLGTDNARVLPNETGTAALPSTGAYNNQPSTGAYNNQSSY